MDFHGTRVALFEGTESPGIADLVSRLGGDLLSVPVAAGVPPRGVLDEMAQGRVDFALFTDPARVTGLLDAARKEGLEEGLRRALRRICIGSAGPEASRALLEAGLRPDHEPETPDAGSLARELARRGRDLLAKKRAASERGIDTLGWRRVDMDWGLPDGERRAITGRSAFMKACRREKTDYTPIWLMRQAGRYQREYRELRARVSFLELCKTPDLAADVTLMAVDRLGVDAAIIFADILLVLEPMGVGLEFSKGEGPVIRDPVRTGSDVDRIRDGGAEELSYVYDAVRTTRRALRPDIPLIGFSGAPFTVASYVVEGGGSRHYEHTKRLMRGDPGAWNALLERLTGLLSDYLNRQVEAGADVVQLFDSWVGCLSPDDYAEFVLPHMRRLIGSIARPTPVIHFGTGNPCLLELMKQAGGQVIGLDWRVDLADGWRRLGNDVAVMGNLDPVTLFSSPEEIRRQARRILDKAAGRPGHIFNLGHGILPGTPPDHATALIDAVHELSAS